MRELYNLARENYFLSHSVGLAPKSTQDALIQAALAPWINTPDQAWPHWLNALDEFRSALAQLINTDIQLLCPQVNLSSAYTKILQALPFNDKRPVILMSKSDFPSMVFVAQQAERLGYKLRLLDTEFDVHDTNAWKNAFSKDVGLVLLSHVYSNTGCRLDVASICAQASTSGVKTIVDIAQSVGVMPIDCQAWQADFILGSCVKWLAGGPGAGFLWVKKENLALCEPIDVGWFSHENPFEFDAQHFKYHASALRFWGGTPSVLPYCVAANSIRNTLDIGVQTIYQHNRQLSKQLWQALKPEHLVSPDCAERSGGTSVIHMGSGQAEFVQRLEQSDILFDQREQGVRLSPHIYNTQTELNRLLSCL